MFRPKGKFITLDGIDGAGKTTQARRLADWLRQHAISVVETHEPYHIPETEVIARFLRVADTKQRYRTLTETLLYIALRHEHVACFIEPAVVRGEWVVCDRFVDSTVAYQGYGQGSDLDVIDYLHRRVLGDCAVDLTFLLDVPPEVSLARGDRGSYYECLGLDFQRRVREGFLTIVRDNPGRCVTVDATQSIDVVFDVLIEHVCGRFGLSQL